MPKLRRLQMDSRVSSACRRRYQAGCARQANQVQLGTVGDKCDDIKLSKSPVAHSHCSKYKVHSKVRARVQHWIHDMHPTLLIQPSFAQLSDDSISRSN